MKLYAWAVLDVKAEYFSTPFFTRSIGEALRGFGDEADNPDSQIARHPHDFHLYLCGWFDQATGKLEMCDPVGHGSAAEHKTRPVGVPTEIPNTIPEETA